MASETIKRIVGFVDFFSDDTRNGYKIPQSEYAANGRNLIIDQGDNEIAGYSDRDEGLYTSVPAVVFGDHTRIIKYVDKPFFIGADGVKILKPQRGVDPKYAYYALKAARIESLGYSRHFKVVKELHFVLPDDAAQRRIAATLDKISEMKRNAEARLQKLDELARVRFVEMFGTTFANPKGWKTTTFRDASLLLSDGPFGSNLKSSHYSESGVRVIRLGNIGVGKFINEDQSYIPFSHYEQLKKYTCRKGELVFGTLGEPNLRACIIPDYIDIAVNKSDCVHYIPKPELLNNQFVCHYVNAPGTLELAAGMVHGQTRSRVSSGQIAQMPIFLPPLSLQRSFAAFVEKVDALKATAQASLDRVDLLYRAKLQEYFG